MDGLAIIVPISQPLEDGQALQWMQPLYPEKVGAVPIFECETPEELQILLSLYDIPSFILANPPLAEALFEPSLIKDLTYTCRIVYVNGVERRILVVPAPTEVDWSQMEPALDRFEEIL